MTTLTLNDLDISAEMDQNAMAAFSGGSGGWTRYASRVLSYTKKYKIRHGKKYCRTVKRVKQFAYRVKISASNWKYCG